MAWKRPRFHCLDAAPCRGRILVRLHFVGDLGHFILPGGCRYDRCHVAKPRRHRCLHRLSRRDCFDMPTIPVLAGLQFLANPKTQEIAQWTPWAWLILLMFPAISLPF